MPNQDTCNSQILSKIIPPLSDEQMDAIWSDPLYGMGSQSSFPIWIQAAKETNTSGTATFLKGYFHLSLSQISGILGNPLQSWISNIDGVLASWWSCPTTPCDPMFLGALQWSQQGVSMNPPNASGTQPFPSIVTANSSAVGFPEISYFLSGYLLKNNFTGNVSKYQNLTFSTDLGLQVLNSTPTPPYQYCGTNQTLLNLKNYEFVLTVGAQFEQQGGSTDNLTGLTPIQERWNLPSLEHTYVFYRYCKYFLYEFALIQSMNGTKGYVGLGTLAATVMYQNFVTLQDFLLNDFLARAIRINVTNDNIGCHDLINNSLGGTTEDKINKTCSLPQMQNYDLDSFKFLVAACSYEQQYAYQVLINNTGMSQLDIMSLCQYQVAGGFGLYYTANQAMLGSFYNCSNLSTSCSDYDFAILQWGSSAITSKLPPILQNEFPVNSSLTVADFYPTVFPKPWEYLPAMKYLSPNFPNETFEPLNYTRCLQLLNFLNFFSGTVIQRAYIFNLTGNLNNFTQLFNISNPVPILTYFRYLVIEYALQGMKQTRSGYDLLYGYTDPILAKVSNTSVLAGGDPSTNPVLALGGQNSSAENARAYYQQAVQTGADNPNNVKNMVQLQYLPYINYNRSYFDGLVVVQDSASPWAENVPIQGTDSTLNRQGLTANDSISVYVPDLYLCGNSTWSGQTLEVQGLTTWKYGIGNKTIANKTNNPDNAKFYFDRWNGAVNISITMRAPIFFTKQYFLDADWDLVTAVELYNDTAMQHRIWPSPDYDLAIFVEPTTGAALKANQRLQANIYFDQDELFPHVRPAMIPLLYVFRGFEFSPQTVHDLFLSLKIGLFLQKSGIWLFIGIGVFLFLMAVVCLFTCRPKPKFEVQENSSMLLGNAVDGQDGEAPANQAHL